MNVKEAISGWKPTPSKLHKTKPKPVEREPQTPYERAAAVWDARTDATTSTAGFWKFACFGLLPLLGLSIAGNVWQSSQVKLRPFIVRTDARGAPSAPMPLDSPIAAKPNEAEIRYFLSQHIERWRSLPADQVVFSKNMFAVMDFLAQSAATKLSGEFRTDPPQKYFGNQTRSVEIVNITAKSASTYEIRWIEKTYSNEGVEIAKDTYTGQFTAVIKPTEDIKILTKNPLGLYITQYDWAKDRL
jgi:type IV secretion system protein TrbF